ncbi:hypothetical protein HPB47_010277 [Ixodes persulcatus]|uniref:Uncharacterized protein n=1 Tax=Ixodes persulcatus TaxID=34615 RepID=A0AC60NZT0_IXOPE|nr:hypothetical protein HPB47_010277 [Ixodes persulcatus]
MTAFTEMSMAHMVTVMVVTTAFFTYADGYCNDLNYFRARQECQNQFEMQMHRAMNVHDSYSTTRHIVCCAYLRATRCVHELSQKEQCIDDSSHKMLTHFRQKSQGKDCERYDYRQCGAAGTAVSSAFLLVATFLLVRLFGTS